MLFGFGDLGVYYVGFGFVCYLFVSLVYCLYYCVNRNSSNTTI